MIKWPPTSSSRSKQLSLDRDPTGASNPLLGMVSHPQASKPSDRRSADISKATNDIRNSSEPDEVVSDGNSAAARSVLRKIDYRIIPLLFITYNLNFMDKTILSSASVLGLSEDTGLKGQEYSWISSVFYFGYFFWEYPTTFIIQKFPVGKYVGVNTIL
jgi:hypothetical protein